MPADPGTLRATAFVDRYSAAFGRSSALMLRLTGLLAGEQAAEGAWIIDDGGRRWLDLGSFGLHLLGHRHPQVVEAATEQLGRMGLSGKILGNTAATALAEALIQTLPPTGPSGLTGSTGLSGLNQVRLANTGAEAVEMALTASALATGRVEFAAFHRAYHGRTAGAISLSDSQRARSPWKPTGQVHILEPGDVDAARRVFNGGRVAAVFVEPVQGEGGIRPVDEAYLTQLAELAHEFGTLVVLDEIQTGLGRCGRVWRSAGRVPCDLLLTGKVLGGGLVPLAAMIYSASRLGAAGSDPVVLTSSFAGGGLAAAVGRAALRIVTEAPFLARVRELGDRASNYLRTSLAGDPRVVEVRGEGLMLGLQTASAQVAGNVVLEAAKRGVLISFCLSDPSVLRLYPPAVISHPDLDAGLTAVVEAIRATEPPAHARAEPHAEPHAEPQVGRLAEPAAVPAAGQP